MARTPLLPLRWQRPALTSLLLATCGVALGLFFGRFGHAPSQARPPVAMSLSAPSPPTSGSSTISRDDALPGMRDWLEGCRYLYVDVGTNVGLQIRKLFEPKLYQRALVRRTFDEYFGVDRLTTHPDELCAVGFEPNPVHAPALRELMENYRQHGWRMHVFTGVAASTVDGEADFYLDEEAPEQYKMPGSSLLSWAPSHEVVKVQTIDLARYLLEEVGQRQFDTSLDDEDGRRPPPAVLMKVDVEGLEHHLMPYLIMTGALCRAPVNLVMMESHLGNEWESSAGVSSLQVVDFFTEFIEEQRRRNGEAATKACPSKIVEKDDEMYDTRTFPLSPPPPPVREVSAEEAGQEGEGNVEG